MAITPEAEQTHATHGIADLVTVVLVTYRSGDIILRSLEALSQDQGVRRIIVIDNARDEASCQAIRDQFPHVNVIMNTHNSGFGQANNIGLELTDTPFALVLNPDACIEPGGIRKMLDIMQREPQIAMLGPWLHDQIGKPIRGGNVWEPQWIKYQPEALIPVKTILGAALLMRMSHLQKSGFFDPGIFLFCEEDDLGERLHRAGYQLCLTTQVTMDHIVGKSSTPTPGIKEMRQQHMVWSRLYVEEKYFGRPRAVQFAQQILKTSRWKKWVSRLIGQSSRIRKAEQKIQAAESFLRGERPSTDPSTYCRHINTKPQQCSSMTKAA